MRNTKLFKIFIGFLDRSKKVSIAPLSVTKKAQNFLLNFPKKDFSFNEKFKIVYSFIYKLTGFSFYQDLYEKQKPKIKVSGLFCPGPKERLLLKANTDSSLNLKRTLILHIMDYCFKLYSKHDIRTFHDLFNLVGNLLTYSNLSLSPYSYPQNHPHNLYSYFTFKQHIFASNFAGYKVPFKYLLDFYKSKYNFDFEEYLKEKNIPLTLILEFHIVFTAFQNLYENNPEIIIMAANPDMPFYGEFRAFIYSILGQPNGDIIVFLLKQILCQTSGNIENIIEKIIPMDVKMKAQPEIKLALFRGYISITPPMADQDQMLFFKRFIGDLKATIKEKESKKLLSVEEKRLCKAWINDMENLIKSKENAEKKQIIFDGLYKNYLLNVNLKNIIPSKIIIAIEDVNFPLYYKTYYNPINLLINKLSPKIDARLFNEHQEVDLDYIEHLILSIGEGWKEIDKDTGEKILANYFKAKKLLQLHDVHDVGL